MRSLEEQLDEKVGEFTMHMTRLKLQEDDVSSKVAEIQDLRADLNKKDKQLREISSAGEKVRRIQQEQFQEFEKQIDIVSGHFLFVCFLSGAEFSKIFGHLFVQGNQPFQESIV